MRNTRQPRPALLALTLPLLAGLLLPGSARAWELFRSENRDVKRGNELLAQGKAEEATKAFDAAQRTLPNDPGVQLNRGLGLMASGKLPEAREAFRAATQGAATPEVRGKAHYNAGLAFSREADALSKEDKLDEAQKFLTEAVDSFKNSLRADPKNPDAAWNLELTRRRLVELEKKKKEKKEQEKQDDQQKQDQDKQGDDKDKQGDDKDKQGDDKDQQQQDQDKQGDPDQQKQDPQPKPSDGQDPKDPQAKPESPGDDKKDQAKAPDKKPEDQQQAPAPSEQAPSPSSPQKALPEHMQQALDALSESDDNLQRQKARARARQRPMRVEKDW
jgi:Ca-activated chloride channel family protein